MITIQILMFMAAFALLSLSIPRHYSGVSSSRQRLNKKQMWRLQFFGYSFIGLALVLAVMAWGITLALVYCCGIAMLAALIISLLLTYKPHWMRFIVTLLKIE